MQHLAVRDLDQEVTSRGFFEDPYPVYRRLQAEDPVHWCEPWSQWLVTRYADVQRVLRDPRRFSSSGWEQRFIAQLPADACDRFPDLLRHYGTAVLSNTDPPAHARLRRLVVKSLTPRVLEALRPGIAELVERLLDGVEQAGRMDAIEDLAYPLPAIVIAELLGAPEEDRDRFTAWSAEIIAFVGTGHPELDRAGRADRSLREFREYLEPLIADRRSRPRDDLLSLLVSPGEGGESLSDRELVATCVTLLFAGHETTANLIGNGLLALLRNPDELARLSEAPALIGTAVEELLRYDAPVQRLRRVVTENVELGGRRIRRDELVMAFVGAANRDAEHFPDPDRLDMGRAGNHHLSFGHGIHFCVGAALSRIEAPTAINAVLRRFPCLRLAEGATVRFRENITFRGLEALELEFD